jgi:hypothetical protein
VPNSSAAGSLTPPRGHDAAQAAAPGPTGAGSGGGGLPLVELDARRLAAEVDEVVAAVAAREGEFEEASLAAAKAAEVADALNEELR